MHRLSLFPILFAIALTAACAPDRPDDQAQDALAEEEEEVYVAPVLTPAESAAAVAKQQADAERMTRQVMGPDYKPPTDTFVDTPQKQYESCMIQANSVEDPVRSTILKACERFRLEAEKQKQ